MKRLLLSFIPLLLLVASCSPKKELKTSCIKKVGMDTRKTFDDEKFLIRVFDESYRGRGQIVNTKTEEVFLVIFNNTIKSDGERNKYQPIPKSAKDVEQAKLNDGRVLFFEASCIDE
tara:strand:+ start:49 stop:399 length:351 start_codon:yes stop_codon:yes gene_type:complete